MWGVSPYRACQWLLLGVLESSPPMKHYTDQMENVSNLEILCWEWSIIFCCNNHICMSQMCKYTDPILINMSFLPYTVSTCQKQTCCAYREIVCIRNASFLVWPFHVWCGFAKVGSCKITGEWLFLADYFYRYKHNNCISKWWTFENASCGVWIFSICLWCELLKWGLPKQLHGCVSFANNIILLRLNGFF